MMRNRNRDYWRRLAQRLIELGEKREIAPQALSKVFGMDRGYLGQLVKRGMEPKVPTLHKIEDWLGTSVAAFMQESTPGTISGRHLGAVFDQVAIRIVGGEISAGDGAVVDDVDESEAARVWLPAALLNGVPHARGDALVAVPVRGDSMLPTLADGDWVIVDTSEITVDGRGGLFVIRVDGHVLVKRLDLATDGGVRVISDNQQLYPPTTTRAEDLVIVGRVVVAWKFMGGRRVR